MPDILKDPTFSKGLLTAGTKSALTTADVAGLGTSATIDIDTDGTLAANSDAKIATQKAVKTYVDTTVTGLLELKGNTDCSGNPNYPAASKGDAYYVTVAGKIGGASGKSVDVGDVYIASADNAGGTEAAVGTSWFVLEHNLSGVALLSGGTFTGDISVPDEAYVSSNWNGSTEVPTKNAIRDKIESLSSSTVTGATDSSLTLTGTTLGINHGNPNTWTVNQIFSLGATVSNANGLKILDTSSDHTLTITVSNNYSANRTLTLTLGDASRTLTMTGDASIEGTHSGTSSGTNTGDISAATQAQQEAASSTTVYTSPGRQQYHPGSCKAWAEFGGTSFTIAASHNLSSITDNGVGDFTLNWTTAFSSTTYCVVGTGDTDLTTYVGFVTKYPAALGTGSARLIQVDRGTGALKDGTYLFVAAFGDQ